MIPELRLHTHTLSHTPCQRPTAGSPCQKWTICSVPGGRSGAIIPLLLLSVRLHLFSIIPPRRIERAACDIGELYRPCRAAGCWLAVTGRTHAAAPSLCCYNRGRATLYFGRSAVNVPGQLGCRSCRRAPCVPLTRTLPFQSRLIGYRGSILRLLFTVGMTWRAHRTDGRAAHKAWSPVRVFAPSPPTCLADRSLVKPAVRGHRSRPGLFSLRSNYVSVPQSRAAIGWT